MVLVDTSVWIHLLNDRASSRLSDRDLLQFRTCSPVIQEVLQGLREDASNDAFRQSFLSIPCLNNPLQLSTFIFASEIYRLGRSRAYTIRSGIDCLIAAIAIENRATLWHRDRDYDNIAKYTSLKATQQHAGIRF